MSVISKISYSFFFSAAVEWSEIKYAENLAGDYFSDFGNTVISCSQAEHERQCHYCNYGETDAGGSLKLISHYLL